MNDYTEGIVLLAKQSGITSFSALWQVKNALSLKKIGHTGTLDTFADGLLVVLIGKYTKLASYFTGCEKEYIADIQFGQETDTLDPDGTVVRETPLPVHKDLCSVLPSFIGSISQIPPVYSALHIDGQRASRRVRNGENLDMPGRTVQISQVELLESRDADGLPCSDESRVDRCHIRVRCSAGTYIRSLARDIAQACGSSAHLRSLRRTLSGPFILDKAAGCSLLPVFASERSFVYGVGPKPPQASETEIRNSILLFTPQMADSVHLSVVYLAREYLERFTKGQTLQPSWFSGYGHDGHTAVFCDDDFVGMIDRTDGNLSYVFVSGSS